MALKDKYFTISEAAKQMAVTRQTVSRWISAGEIPAERVGREVLIAKADISRYQRDRKLVATGAAFAERIIAYIRKRYGYSEDDKIGILRFRKKSGTFWFYCKTQGGDCEIISITLDAPGDIEQSKDEPFITLGVKFPIVEIDRRVTTESELRNIRNADARRLKVKGVVY